MVSTVSPTAPGRFPSLPLLVIPQDAMEHRTSWESELNTPLQRRPFEETKELLVKMKKALESDSVEEVRSFVRSDTSMLCREMPTLSCSMEAKALLLKEGMSCLQTEGKDPDASDFALVNFLHGFFYHLAHSAQKESSRRGLKRVFLPSLDEGDLKHILCHYSKKEETKSWFLYHLWHIEGLRNIIAAYTYECNAKDNALLWNPEGVYYSVLDTRKDEWAQVHDKSQFLACWLTGFQLPGYRLGNELITHLLAKRVLLDSEYDEWLCFLLKKGYEGSYNVANILTILNTADKDLSDQMWEGLKAAGAYLPNVVLSRSNLMRADLRGVTLSRATLDGANMAYALLEGVVWGEYLPFDDGGKQAVTVRYSPDGKQLAMITGAHICLLDTFTNEIDLVLRDHTSMVTSMAYAHDSSKLVSASARMLCLWNPQDGTLSNKLVGSFGIVLAIAFSPGGDTIAFASFSKEVYLWHHTQPGLVLETFKVHTGLIYGLDFSPDGEQLASASWNKIIHLKNLADKSHDRFLVGHTSRIYRIAYSPDSIQIASASEDCTIRLWNAKLGTLEHVLADEGHKRLVSGIAYSSKGKKLFSSSYDKTIRRWDTKTGALELVFAGHTAPINDLILSPDSYLVSLADNGEVYVWNAISGRCKAKMTGYKGKKVCSIALSPDGNQLALKPYEESVRFFSIKDLFSVTGGNKDVAFSCWGTNFLEAKGLTPLQKHFLDTEGGDLLPESDDEEESYYEDSSDEDEGIVWVAPPQIES